MTRGVAIVRLLASVAISLAACRFVVAYSQVSFARHKLDHPTADAIVSGGMFIRAYGGYMCIFPVVALLVGSLFIWRWPNRPALIEIITSALWVLALIWVGVVVWYCQVINLPIFTHMQAQYPY
jgi:hypothetical protein